MADEIRGLKSKVQQLRELVQKLATMIQEQREESKVRATQSEKQIDSQTRKIELLHGVVEKGISKPSYSEIVQGNNRSQPSQAVQLTTPRTDGPRSQSTKGELGATSPRYRDERVVSIDTISTALEDKRDPA
jgi:TolA-binding protein